MTRRRSITLLLSFDWTSETLFCLLTLPLPPSDPSGQCDTCSYRMYGHWKNMPLLGENEKTIPSHAYQCPHQAGQALSVADDNAPSLPPSIHPFIHSSLPPPPVLMDKTLFVFRPFSRRLNGWFPFWGLWWEVWPLRCSLCNGRAYFISGCYSIMKHTVCPSYFDKG
jgi:hypothetical protein